MTDGTYSATTNSIEVVDGVSVDITVEGDEDRAGKVLMDLKERLGRIGAAYEAQTPPADLPTPLKETYPDYAPLMTINWDSVFDEDGDGE